MGEDLIYNLGGMALRTTAMVAAPLLLSALIIGLMVSVFQAITQINEATLTFIPKIIVVGIVLTLGGPWMVDELSQFTITLMSNIAEYVRY
ncbi:MAG: flagellar biosynthesis protein FliQ [Bdellovibrionota bacterium]|nr:flagellar biosynthetic protein FliQ [Pseudobdellovibrionaceae bacterium]MEC9281871.1 flagellar biosynthesis protein FliQ [Bdellovibrionota bacterium]|tara:strand:+ start:12317 stop:12589 length:273 start_codon:yes stop_codon:yes gene_type:complete